MIPTLEKHLKREHKVSAISIHLKEIVYGGTDGIVTTFAVVAGFNGAQVSSFNVSIPFLAVTLFGFASLFADGISMALGNFLSVRANQDVYKLEKTKELYEIRNAKEFEIQETVEILTKKGFTQKDAMTITEIYAKNERYWLEFMMKDELEMPNPEGENPYLTGLTTLLSFVLFGFIPLIPYVFGIKTVDTFRYSIIFTFAALVLLGLFRFKVTKEGIKRSLFEVILLGGVSALVAYFVGTLFAM